ncbi:hypothetical protein [Nitrosospira sp. Nsp13]|jgi:hypothetical protein|uniref:hypothetical protein n=1 Tax=Nitrosospira sp. Nsp13 TaxID=1855332 RepID=UPI00088CB09B|nr:hypothetical protein [Nitrosospira sp. Nsp13]SCX81285.1 hypothetical protein SAMN05216308_101375 [Nitrosospira sp. Nsp13]
MKTIREVTEVRLAVLESFPPKLRITATGNVPTGGWSNPQLNPVVNIQAPPDGIYDFDFVADPPEGPATQVISSIQAVYVWDSFPADVKGVRVNAAQNSITAWLDDRDQQPNRYTFSDCEGVKRVIFFPRALGPLGISESKSDAQLEYNGSEGQFVFRGDDISQEQTILGLLISVTLQPNADAGGLDFALILPPVQLGGHGRQEFETMGIKIHSRGRVIRPAGAELTYEVIKLSGIAEDIPIL